MRGQTCISTATSLALDLVYGSGLRVYVRDPLHPDASYELSPDGVLADFDRRKANGCFTADEVVAGKAGPEEVRSIILGGDIRLDRSLPNLEYTDCTLFRERKRGLLGTTPRIELPKLRRGTGSPVLDADIVAPPKTDAPHDPEKCVTLGYTVLGSDGIVTMSENLLSPENILHEFTHQWFYSKVEASPDLTSAVERELMDGSNRDVADKVRRHYPEYQDMKGRGTGGDVAGQWYRNRVRNDFLGEVAAHLCGERLGDLFFEEGLKIQFDSGIPENEKKDRLLSVLTEKARKGEIPGMLPRRVFSDLVSSDLRLRLNAYSQQLFDCDNGVSKFETMSERHHGDVVDTSRRMDIFPTSDGRISIRTPDGTWLSFDRMSKESEGVHVVRKDDKYNYLTKDGNLLARNWLDRASPFVNGKAVCRLGDADLTIDRRGIVLDRKETQSVSIRSVLHL